MRFAVLLMLVLSTAVAAAPKAKKGKAPAAKAASASEKNDAAKAKELFKWAQKLYKQARYPEAIAKFEEAYALKPHPVIYFNIGRCHEQVGDVGKAMRAYKDYLRLSPDAKDRETVSDAIANLERRLKEQGMQQLMVYTDPVNASIEVDGQALGGSPASVELKAGNHKLVVSAEGFEKVERSFVMQTSRSSEMTINLRPVAKDTPALVVNDFPPPPPPPPADVPKKDDDKKLEPKKDEPKKVAVVEPPTVVKPGPKKSGGRLFTWVAAGVAVVGAGAGVGLGVVASGAEADLKNREKAAMRTSAETEALQGTASSMALGANVSYGAAITAAVAAGVLFFVEGGSSGPSTAPSTSATGKAFVFQF